jgi:hypothetical protein
LEGDSTGGAERSASRQRRATHGSESDDNQAEEDK